MDLRGYLAQLPGAREDTGPRPRPFRLRPGCTSRANAPQPLRCLRSGCRRPGTAWSEGKDGHVRSQIPARHAV